MIETVVIVRHGERLDKENQEWVLSTAAPWDTPLSEAGNTSALRLASELRKADLSGPIIIYTSPFLRCAQTAAPIAREFGTNIRMCSIFGEWMTPEYFEYGAPPSDNHASVSASSKLDLLREYAGSIDFSWGLGALGDAGPYGETWTEMHERASRGIDAALQDPSSAAAGTLIVVSHGSLCNGMIAHLRQVPQMGIIGMGEYVVIRR